jgi:multidrug efflux pump subunit AcrA (membrane-fusion protein)
MKLLRRKSLSPSSSSSCSPAASTGTARARADAGTALQAADHRTGELTQTVSANGTLNPVVLVNVGTQVSGTVTRLYVDFNDKVEKGQALLELDDSLLAAQARQSAANVVNVRAALDLARANEKRMKALFERGIRLAPGTRTGDPGAPLERGAARAGEGRRREGSGQPAATRRSARRFRASSSTAWSTSGRPSPPACRRRR